MRPRDLPYHELLGLKARIISSMDPTLLGLEGVIALETPRTLILDVRGRRVTVVKQDVVLEIELPKGGKARIPGRILIGSPADRAKRVLRGR